MKNDIRMTIALSLLILVITGSCSVIKKKQVCLTGMMENKYQVFQNESLVSRVNDNWLAAVIVLDGDGVGYYFSGFEKVPIEFDYRFDGDTLLLSSKMTEESSTNLYTSDLDSLSLLFIPQLPTKMLKKSDELIDISDNQPPLYRMKYSRMISIVQQQQ